MLTEAAINGKVDYLRGLKENVITGSLVFVAGARDEVGRSAGTAGQSSRHQVANLAGAGTLHPAVLIRDLLA